MVPGSAQSHTVTGLAGGVTYYFVLWTGDEIPNWSDISNTASVLLAPSPPATGEITARSQTTLTAGWGFSLGTSSYTFVASTAPDNPPVAVIGSSVTVALSGTAEMLTLYSAPTAVIDNVGDGRYIFPGAAGTAAVLPQGLLTGVGHSRHVVALTALSAADGAIVSQNVTVLDAVSGVSAGVVSFAPLCELTVALSGVTSGERPVEILSGSSWLLAGTAHVGPPGVARFDVKRTGVYRVMNAATGSLVKSVVCRIFTPNGDGQNDATVVRLNNPDGLNVHGEIYDMDGVHIADMLPGPAQGLSLMWDGKDSHGDSAMGGVYVYQVTVGNARATGTIVVSK